MAGDNVELDIENIKAFEIPDPDQVLEGIGEMEGMDIEGENLEALEDM